MLKRITIIKLNKSDELVDNKNNMELKSLKLINIFNNHCKIYRTIKYYNFSISN